MPVPGGPCTVTPVLCCAWVRMRCCSSFVGKGSSNGSTSPPAAAAVPPRPTERPKRTPAGSRARPLTRPGTGPASAQGIPGSPAAAGAPRRGLPTPGPWRGVHAAGTSRGGASSRVIRQEVDQAESVLVPAPWLTPPPTQAAPQNHPCWALRPASCPRTRSRSRPRRAWAISHGCANVAEGTGTRQTASLSRARSAPRNLRGYRWR